jgi:hypothetical protein
LAEKTRTNPAARRSITSHPLFPVIVVLWCGALFGMASLAIRTEMIESAVMAAGIDRVVPMAAPPLGKTARILIALLATGLGCLVGLLVMSRISKPRAQAPVRRRRSASNAEEAASPVSVFGADPVEPEAEEAIEEADAAPSTPTGRLRRFTRGREEHAEPADIAPLPGAQILNVAELDLDSFERNSDAPRWVRNIDRDDSAPEAMEPAPGRNALFDSYARGLNREPAGEEAAAEPGFELLAPEDEDAAQPQSVLSPAPGEDIRPRAQGSAAERIAAAPLDALSPVELLERLALAIERRRAAARAAAEARAAAVEAEVASGSVEPAPQPVPAAMRPVEPDIDAQDEEPLPGYVPPRHIGLNTPSAEARMPALSDSGEDEGVLAEGYSSLRNFSRPPAPAPQPVPAPRPAQRFDRPPAERSVFPFPAQSETDAPASTAPNKPVRTFDAPTGTARDKEAELRKALAALQRMSGAA